MKEESYRRYGKTSLHLAQEIREGGYALALSYQLKDLTLKARPVLLKSIIGYAVSRLNDAEATIMLPVFDRAIVDAAWSNHLIRDEKSRMEDQYLYPDVEYLCFHPATGTRPEVVEEMCSLYRSLPYSEFHGSARVFEMPNTKSAIIEILMRYWGTHECSAQKMVELAFERIKGDFTGKEFELWDSAFRNHRNTKDAQTLRRFAKIVIDQKPGNMYQARYKDQLLKTAMIGWMHKATSEQIEAVLDAAENPPFKEKSIPA